MIRLKVYCAHYDLLYKLFTCFNPLISNLLVLTLQSPKEDWYGMDVAQWFRDTLILSKNVAWQRGQRCSNTPLERGLMATLRFIYAGWTSLFRIQSPSQCYKVSLHPCKQYFNLWNSLLSECQKVSAGPHFFEWNATTHSGASNILLATSKIQLNWIFYHLSCALYQLVPKIMAVTFACTLLLVTERSFTTLRACQEAFMLPKQ